MDLSNRGLSSAQDGSSSVRAPVGSVCVFIEPHEGKENLRTSWVHLEPLREEPVDRLALQQHRPRHQIACRSPGSSFRSANGQPLDRPATPALAGTSSGNRGHHVSERHVQGSHGSSTRCSTTRTRASTRGRFDTHTAIPAVPAPMMRRSNCAMLTPLVARPRCGRSICCRYEKVSVSNMSD